MTLGLSEPPTDRELFAQLESGEVDLAFCSLPLSNGPFEAIELMNDPYVLLVPASGPLADRGPLTLDDLGEIPIIGCAATGVKLEDALRATGHKLEFAFRSDSKATLQALVAAGYGVALIPLLAVTPGDDERVKVVNLTPAIPSRRLAVAWHRDRHRSLAARALIDIARAASAELVRELLRLQSVPSTVPGNA